ncbi:LURP-one-related/scramblase family protein [Streptococcus marmotae]|uniref:LURP-one-related/scramblase family protein n=1 Tax=Streptococcus marmotae TaxID=1825069 RepID=UPI00082A1C7F|nr:LURP-one-related family protein [Streptococcus marmotae]
MKQFQIKQRFWSWGGKFDIKDDRGQLCYQVEGSLLKWFKNFEIRSANGQLVSTIQRKFSGFFSRFEVKVLGQAPFTIQKKFSWFKPRYEIENLGLEVIGDFWDMKFDLIHNGTVVAKIDQEWFRMTSTYQVTVYEDAYADVTIALVIAIDYVKEMRSASAAAAT